MGVARDSLGQLNIRAPVTGQLSGFDIQLGQSLQQGERVGQIDSAGGDKLQADVDEFYLGRVAVGQTASADIDGKTYRLKVAKVYPQVRNGQFQIDLLFVGPEPQSMQRGQTVQAKLTLGDASKALLVPNGAFFNDTGGTWVFVVDKSGNGATRRAGPARPPQQRFHRGAERPPARRPGDHLLIQRPHRQGPPDLQLRGLRKEPDLCLP